MSEIENPADIIPAVVERIHRLIGSLERKRADPLYKNSAGEIEFSPAEVDKMIAGLKEWAEALALAHRYR